jgi:4'-phosphopantetheinyl transferase
MTAPRTADLWRIPAPVPDAISGADQGADPRRLLSATEIARADAFRFAADRARFVAFRAALREILGRYLNEPPERIELIAGPYGKPHLSGDAVHFNLAHSGAQAVLAVSRHGPIGVDIEKTASARHADRLARGVLSPSECAVWAALPAAARGAAFLRAWTCKEAYAKATGEGLSLALTRITVALDGPTRLIEVEGRTDEEQRWTIHALDVGPVAAGALACVPSMAVRWFGHVA